MSTEANKPQEVITKSTEEKVVEKSQQFWSKNSKLIIIALVGIVVIVGGFFGYQAYQGPKELEANEAIWVAQQNFKMDSFQLALNGDNSKNNPGFLKVISKHSGTKAANLASFYAGVCYLHMGDFNNAIKFLDQYKAVENIDKMRTAGSLGDAYAELGKFDKAAEFYKTAASVYEVDELSSSEYLFRAGQAFEKQGKNKEAIDAFKSLKDKFPLTERGRNIDMFLARLGDTNN